MKNKGSRLLINDNPILVSPKLAKLIGLNEAIVLQQIHYWLMNVEEKKAKDHYRDGKWWVYNTVSEWREQFSWWSEKTISRTLTSLKNMGIIIATDQYNKFGFDRTLWYTIDYNKLDELVYDDDLQQGANQTSEEDILSQPEGQSVHMEEDILSQPIPETTTETTTENMHTNVDSTTVGGNAKKVDSIYKPDLQKNEGQAHTPKRGRAKRNKGSPYVTRPLVNVDSANVKITKGNAHFMALAEVCKIDVRGATVNQRHQLGQSSKILRERLEATPEQIRNFARWWYKNDWRGQRGQLPKPAQVRECWGRYMDETAGGKAVGVVRIGR